MKTMIKLIMIALVVICLNSCNALENESTSSSILIIKDLTDENGETPIFSDVALEVIDTDEDGNEFIILYPAPNDLCQATVTANLLDPYYGDKDFMGNSGESIYQQVIIDQVDVEYSRADGLNTEGVDIPTSFSQKVNFFVEIEGETEFSFTVVRHSAKAESPLVELIDGNREKILKLEAKITIHARDVAKRRLAPAIGYVSVFCYHFTGLSDRKPL